MAALQHISTPGFSAILLRRSLTELKQSGALLDRASNWLNGTDAKWSGDEHTYSFPTRWPNGKPGPPSKLQFGYLGDFNVEQRYQGAEYQFVGIDEASHFETDTAPTYLFSRLRKNVCPKHQLKKDANGDMVANYVDGCMFCDVYKSIPLRFRMASNPGGPGHRWLKDRYQIKKEVITRTVEGIEGKSIRFIGKHPARPFIPSKLGDNTFIDQKAYRTSLTEMDDIRRLQLEEGDWDVSPDSRFRLDWINNRFYKARGEYYNLNGKIYDPSQGFKRIFATIDPAASTTKGLIDQTVTRRGPSFTVISVWGLTMDYQLLWLYMRRFRQEIPDVIDQIVEVYKAFRPQYMKMETNGVGLGAAQVAQMRGVPIVANPKAKDKIENATNAIYRVKSGRVWFPEQAPWLEDALNEVFTWTGDPAMTDDIVDTLSDACNDVTWDAQGQDPVFQSESIMPNCSPQFHKISLGYSFPGGNLPY